MVAMGARGGWDLPRKRGAKRSPVGHAAPGTTGQLLCEQNIIPSISSRNRSGRSQEAFSEQHNTSDASVYPNLDERTRLSFTHSLIEHVVFPHRRTCSCNQPLPNNPAFWIRCADVTRVVLGEDCR